MLFFSVHHHVEPLHVDGIDRMGANQIAIPEGALAILECDDSALAGQTGEGGTKSYIEYIAR